MHRGFKFFLLFALFVTCAVVGWRNGQDLGPYYKVALWLGGGNLDLVYAADAENFRWYYYGPVTLPFLKLLASFSYEGVKVIWLSLHTIFYVLFWVFLYRLYPVLGERRFIVGWIVVWIASINPLHTGFHSQNIQHFLAAMILGAECLTIGSRRGAQFFGGFICALAGAIKVYPLFIALLYLVLKPRTVKVGVLCGFLFSVLFPVLVFGFSDAQMLFFGWVDSLSAWGGIYSLATQPENLSMASSLARWLEPVLSPIMLTVVTQSLFGLIALLFFGFVWRNRRNQDPGFHGQVLALGCVLMIFLNATSRLDYFIFFVPAFASMVQGVRDRMVSRWVVVYGGLALGLIAFTTEFVVGGKALNDLLEGWRVPVLGVVFLVFGCVLGFGARARGVGATS